jgi:serine/threonine protein kinase
MHRLTIQRKISDTLLGATYECRFNSTPPPTGTLLTTATVQRPRSSVALKCSSLSTRKQLLDASEPATALDDPLQERRVVASLLTSGGHTNVLQCYDHFITTDRSNGDDVVCVVTEFCTGGDLFSYLTASSTQGIGERETVSLMSLENVLLQDGVCKLADFGLTTPVGERCTECVGKPQYMAPEVATDYVSTNGYDPSAADVWSLGVMLFMLVTGSPLVDVASREDPRFIVVMRHGISAVLLAWDIEVSSTLVELMELLLQEDPVKRPTIVEIVGKLTELNAALEVATERSAL